MRFVCRSCGNAFEMGGPQGLQVPCPVCGGALAAEEAGAAAQPPGPPEAGAFAPEQGAEDDDAGFSLDAAEAYAEEQASGGAGADAMAAPGPVAPAPAVGGYAPVPSQPEPDAGYGPVPSMEAGEALGPVPSMEADGALGPVPSDEVGGGELGPVPAVPSAEAQGAEMGAYPQEQAPLVSPTEGYDPAPQAADAQGWPDPQAAGAAGEQPVAGEWAEGAEQGMVAPGEAMAQGAQLPQAYQGSGAPPHAGGSLLLMAGWVAFAVSLVGLFVAAYFIKNFYKQLQSKGDPEEIEKLKKNLEKQQDLAAKREIDRADAMTRADGSLQEIGELKANLWKAEEAAKTHAKEAADLKGKVEGLYASYAKTEQERALLRERSSRSGEQAVRAAKRLRAVALVLRAAEFLNRPERWGGALSDLDAAIETGADCREAYWLRGLILVRLRQPKEALRDFDRVDELAQAEGAKGHARALVAAGDVCRTQLKDLNRAKDYYGRAKKVAADSPAGRLAQARSLLVDRRAAECRKLAAGAIKEAEDASEDTAKLRLCLAEALAALDETRAAIEEAGRAIASDPASVEALDLRARLLYEEGHYEQAAQDLSRAVELDQERGERLLNLGSALIRLGRYGAAEPVLRRAAKALPDDVGAKLKLSEALVRNQEYEAALGELEKVFEVKEDNVAALRLRGEARVGLKQFRGGLADLDKALQLGGENARVRILIAVTYATATDTRYRKPRKAVDNARNAVELTEGRDPEALSALAQAYAASGDYNKAANEMRRALDLDPGNKAFEEALRQYERLAR